MKLEYWPIDPELNREIDEHYRTQFALAIEGQDSLEVVKAITFDGVAPNLSVNELSELIGWVNKSFVKGKLQGVGLELGAGCGFFAALLANLPKVQKVYAVEVCQNIVERLMPKIVKTFSPAAEDKLIGCVGEFDQLNLPNDSIDFTFEFFSFHHSKNLVKTFTELHRVMKPGGVVVCFDKARDNNLTNDDLEKLLDQEYSSAAKEKMGLDPNLKVTRRMNGENEYRLKDWGQSFKAAGFTKFEHYHLARLSSGNIVFGFIKNFIALLPVKLQARVTNLIGRRGNKNNLEINNQVYTKLINNLPKEISLMLVWK